MQPHVKMTPTTFPAARHADLALELFEGHCFYLCMHVCMEVTAGAAHGQHTVSEVGPIRNYAHV